MNKIESISLSMWKKVTAPYTPYKKMNFPRWDSIRIGAKHAISMFHFMKDHKYKMKKNLSIHVLAMQTFSGLRQEWVEENLPWR